MRRKWQWPWTRYETVMFLLGLVGAVGAIVYLAEKAGFS